MSQIAYLFPGQGSQMVGMGADFAQEHPAAKVIFDEADSLLEMPFSKLMFDGPEDDLNQTINTQPALYIASIAMLRVIEETLPHIQPAFLAGHSLGEFTALTAAGALSFADGLRLVRERGRLMGEAGEQHPGAMAALLGLDADTVTKICQDASDETSLPVVLANDNCPGQIVISGDTTALDKALELASDAGARKTVKLAVSVAAHSPLMQPASAQFTALLTEIDFQAPQTPVYGNVSAQSLNTVDDIRSELDQQLTQSVRWTETLQTMIADGATAFVEIGSGDVLTALVKRIDRKMPRHTVNSVEALQALGEAFPA